MKTRPERIILDVPYELKTEFKAAASLNGSCMTHVMVKLIKAYLGRNRRQIDRLIGMYRNKGENLEAEGD
jgi:hypothetical protein